MKRRGLTPSVQAGAVGAVALLSAFAAIEPTRGQETLPTARTTRSLNRLLSRIRTAYELPGLIAGIVRGDRLVATGAVGVRRLGSPPRIRTSDKMQLGSCTKAMTATLIAELIEKKKLDWRTTVIDVFPEWKKLIHPDFRLVTLDQLLTHRAGLPNRPPPGELEDIAPAEGPIIEQRRAMLLTMLQEPPVTVPGTHFEYSNVGYVLAAAMAEKVSGAPWEQLMREELFEPLGMRSAGFGFPGTIGKVNQPWGHRWARGEIVPVQRAVPPPVMGPAGAVYCSLADWSRFVVLHLQGDLGKARLLKARTFARLHTPPPGQEYACGWVVAEDRWAGRVLKHDGTNMLWFAQMLIAPQRDFAVLVATNQGGPPARQACKDAIDQLVDYYAANLYAGRPSR